jgi:hypothetical protein
MFWHEQGRTRRYTPEMKSPRSESISPVDASTKSQTIT